VALYLENIYTKEYLELVRIVEVVVAGTKLFFFAKRCFEIKEIINKKNYSIISSTRIYYGNNQAC